VRILVVDDHILVRDGIASLLRAEGFTVAGEAADGLEALAKARELNPDLVLMDIKMPGVGGLEATRLIKAEMPQVKVVMLTVSGEEQDLFEAIKSGAQGYLLKDLKPAEFFDSLRDIQAGQAVIPRRLAGRILEEFRNLALRQDAQHPEGDLTARERDILRRVAAGHTGKQIARSLHLSESAIKFHMRKIVDKLHLHNRAQLVAWAVQHGLTSEEPS
jgi:DNA-binding NarL/FixJ family response regulator